METLRKIASLKVFRWLLVLSWMGVIYYLSDQPTSNAVTLSIFGSLNFIVRKLAHITEFAFLFLFSSWAASLHLTINAQSKRLALLITFAYALLDEWHQSFIPGRSATWGDILIDLSGALLCWLGLSIAAKASYKSTS